jgi:endoglycosylceramidase
VRAVSGSLLLCAGLLLGACAVHRAEVPGLLALTVGQDGGARIVDVGGRQVLLRGVNVNQLVDYYAQDPALPTVQPLSEADFADMARLGFNVVRLGVSWSRLEPSPGTFDDGYLGQIRQAVGWASRHGLYTVLGLHQDAWSKFVASPPGVVCPPGLSPAIGWDGAPAWATLLDGMSTCRGPVREISPAVVQAFTNFYLNRDGIQTELVKTWAYVVRAFAADPAVAGYDLFNEPHPGNLQMALSTARLADYYRGTIDAIRAAESAVPDGVHHLVFVEPNLLWPVLGAAATPRPGFTTDPLVVFAPHLYAESNPPSAGSLPSSPLTIEQGFLIAQVVADSYHAPLWAGEWGWFGDPQTDAPKVRRYTTAANAYRIGGAWWVWKRACGEPINVTASGIAPVTGNLNRYACPSGAPLGMPQPFVIPLSAAYPQAAPGRLTALHSDPDTGGITLTGYNPNRAANCQLVLWLPDRGRGAPHLTTSHVTDLTVQPVTGGFHVTGCASDSYTVTATA